MVDHRNTTVVVLTPPGRGAIATILVEGPDALKILEGRVRLPSAVPLSKRSIGRIVAGRWDTTYGEEVVVCRRGENRIEVHCHGGHVASQSIVDRLIQDGCHRRTWQTWICDENADPILCAARIALAETPTTRTARILWEQRSGALRKEITALEQELAHRNATDALTRIDRLLNTSGLGLHLVKPWRVVVTGPPNVGKSSLINALLGYGRAIVHDEPGTTRDVLSARTAFEGWPVELLDTAGLRQTKDAIEQAGMELARRQIEVADLVLLMFGLDQPWNSELDGLCSQWPQAVVVHNKCDLGHSSHPRPGLSISAVTGAGPAELQQVLAHRLVPNCPLANEGVLFSEEQLASVQQLRGHVNIGAWEAAREQLREPPWTSKAMA